MDKVDKFIEQLKGKLITDIKKTVVIDCIHSYVNTPGDIIHSGQVVGFANYVDDGVEYFIYDLHDGQSSYAFGIVVGDYIVNDDNAITNVAVATEATIDLGIYNVLYKKYADLDNDWGMLAWAFSSGIRFKNTEGVEIPKKQSKYPLFVKINTTYEIPSQYIHYSEEELVKGTPCQYLIDNDGSAHILEILNSTGIFPTRSIQGFICEDWKQGNPLKIATSGTINLDILDIDIEIILAMSTAFTYIYNGRLTGFFRAGNSANVYYDTDNIQYIPKGMPVCDNNCVAQLWFDDNFDYIHGECISFHPVHKGFLSEKVKCTKLTTFFGQHTAYTYNPNDIKTVDSTLIIKGSDLINQFKDAGVGLPDYTSWNYYLQDLTNPYVQNIHFSSMNFEEDVVNIS